MAVPILLIAVLIAQPMLPAKWFERMETIAHYEEDGSVRGRLEAWNYATNRALANPITGGGFETFRTPGVRDAHSAYFEILGEHGFIALVLWLNLLLGTIFVLQRIYMQASRYEKLEWAKDYARSVQLALIAYAVGGAFLGVAYWDFFYHLVAIAGLLKIITQRQLQENAGHASERPPAKVAYCTEQGQF